MDPTRPSDAVRVSIIHSNYTLLSDERKSCEKDTTVTMMTKRRRTGPGYIIIYTTGVADAVASPRANYLLGSTFLGDKAPAPVTLAAGWSFAWNPEVGHFNTPPWINSFGLGTRIPLGRPSRMYKPARAQRDSGRIIQIYRPPNAILSRHPRAAHGAQTKPLLLNAVDDDEFTQWLPKV